MYSESGIIFFCQSEYLKLGLFGIVLKMFLLEKVGSLSSAITVNLAQLNPNITQIYFFINNAGKEDFAEIPYAKIRMYEGTPTSVKEVFASYNIAAEPQFAGKRSMILGKLYKKDAEWKFNAIGDPTDDVFLGQTIHRIVKSYL